MKKLKIPWFFSFQLKLNESTSIERSSMESHIKINFLSKNYVKLKMNIIPVGKEWFFYIIFVTCYKDCFGPRLVV